MKTWMPAEICRLSADGHALNRILDVIPFPVYVTDVDTLTLVSVNKAMQAKTGATVGEACHWAIYRQASPCRFCRIQTLAAQDSPSTIICEHFNERDGGWYQLHESLLTWFDGRTVMHSLAVDVGRLKHAQEELTAASALLALKNAELERSSITDALTGLANRRGLDQALEDGLKRARDTGQPVSVIIIDIDRFKSINDTHGHQAGDMVLQTLADILRRDTRFGDTVGRWGGEEFLVIAPNTTLDDAVWLAQQLRGVVEGVTFAMAIRATVSLGVAALRPDDSVTDLVARADRALYGAKLGGRNRVMFDTGEPNP